MARSLRIDHKLAMQRVLEKVDSFRRRKYDGFLDLGSDEEQSLKDENADDEEISLNLPSSLLGPMEDDNVPDEVRLEDTSLSSLNYKSVSSLLSDPDVSVCEEERGPRKRNQSRDPLATQSLHSSERNSRVPRRTTSRSSQVSRGTTTSRGTSGGRRRNLTRGGSSRTLQSYASQGSHSVSGLSLGASSLHSMPARPSRPSRSKGGGDLLRGHSSHSCKRSTGVPKRSRAHRIDRPTSRRHSLEHSSPTGKIRRSCEEEIEAKPRRHSLEHSSPQLRRPSNVMNQQLPKLRRPSMEMGQLETRPLRRPSIEMGLQERKGSIFDTKINNLLGQALEAYGKTETDLEQMALAVRRGSDHEDQTESGESNELGISRHTLGRSQHSTSGSSEEEKTRSRGERRRRPAGSSADRSMKSSRHGRGSTSNKSRDGKAIDLSSSNSECGDPDLSYCQLDLHNGTVYESGISAC